MNNKNMLNKLLKYQYVLFHLVLYKTTFVGWGNIDWLTCCTRTEISEEIFTCNIDVHGLYVLDNQLLLVGAFAVCLPVDTVIRQGLSQTLQNELNCIGFTTRCLFQSIALFYLITEA